jgi:hypothetical protein
MTELLSPLENIACLLEFFQLDVTSSCTQCNRALSGATDRNHQKAPLACVSRKNQVHQVEWTRIALLLPRQLFPSTPLAAVAP